MSFELNKDFDYKFERAIFLGVNQHGGRFPRTGVWIVGIIHKEGPKYIKQLQEEYNEFADKIGVGGMTYESMKKNVHYLRRAGVLNALSADSAESLGLEIESTKNGRQRKYHNLCEDIETGWIDLEPETIATQPRLIDDFVRDYRIISRTESN